MATDGDVVLKAVVDDRDAQEELKKLEKKVGELEKALYKQQKKQMPMLEQMKELGAELDAEKARLMEMQSGDTMYWTTAQIKGQEKTVAALQKQFDAVDTKAAAMGKEIAQTERQLDAAKEQAADLQAQIAGVGTSGEKMAEATKKARDYMKTFGKQLSRVVRRVLVFSVLASALRAIRSYLWDAIRQNDEAVAAVARLKGALMTLAQPIVEVVIPAFTLLVNVITRIVYAVARLVSLLFGTTVQKASQGAKALNAQADAIEGVGKAAKEASGSLADFDELTTISYDSGGDSGLGGTGAGGSGGIAADFAGPISDQLTAIAELFVGSALLALGAILTFSGVNIPLGLALMALGAIAMWDAVTENWDAIKTALQGSLLGAAMLFAGTALLVIGAVLAFSGAAIGLGIGLMIAGLALGIPAAAANWDSMGGTISQVLAELWALLVSSLLVIGSILALSGISITLGIALMAAGCAALAATVALSPEGVVSFLREPVFAIMTLLLGAALVVGAIIAFSGAAIPLGIALMAMGAMAIVAPIAANWDSIVSALQGPIGKMLACVSSALLVIGIVLLCTGVGIPLGLGLIVAGAAGLAAAITPNWDFLLDKGKEIWDSIKNWWKAHVAKFFTAAWWRNLGSTAINGLLSGLQKAWTTVMTWVQNAVNWISNMFSRAGSAIGTVGGGSGGIGGYGAYSRTTRYAMPEVRQVEVPALAQGRVIPANREFLALLGDQKHGTNVEAPLSTIQQAVVQAIGELSPELAQAVVAAFAAAGVLGNIRAIEDYTRATAQKEFSLGKPSSAAGRWVSQSMEAYDAVRG